MKIESFISIYRAGNTIFTVSQFEYYAFGGALNFSVFILVIVLGYCLIYKTIVFETNVLYNFSEVSQIFRY